MKTIWNITWSKYSWWEIYKILTSYCNIFSNSTIPKPFNSGIIHIAAKNGDTKLLQKILETEEAIDINLPNAYGWTPLHFATHYNNFDMVKLLVELGANIRAETIDGYGAIDFSGKHFNREILKYLISKGEKLPDRSSIFWGCGNKNIPLNTLFYGKDFILDLIPGFIENSHLKKFVEAKIDMQPQDFKYDAKLFSDHIRCLYAAKDFLESKNYLHDEELKAKLTNKLIQYAKAPNLEASIKPILTLKALCMFSIINNNKSLDTDTIPDDILAYSKEQYNIDLKLLGKENIDIIY